MQIEAEEIVIGADTLIEPTAVIRGINGKAKKIHIGDNCYIGHNVQIICDEFRLGDFSKIQHSTNIHGYMPCVIGHNAWIGQYCILDSIGGMTIGNNCGIGAHSQLWSHIKFGDVMEGCRFKSEKPMVIGNDVWFVGHCIVSPIVAEDKSMAMVGSVVTKNMVYNTIYAGSPAQEISSKIGVQFENISLDEKRNQLVKHLEASGISKERIKIVSQKTQIVDDEASYFCVEDRSYTKRRTAEEIAFMKYLLPEKAKFTPYDL